MANASKKVVVTYGNSGKVIIDRGSDKSPRFELFDTKTNQTISKSNNPYTFDALVTKDFSHDLESTLNEDGGLW